jgi:hypothetical protein
MTDEAEKIAIGDAVFSLRATKEKLAALEKRMQAAGQSLENFGSVLKNPDRFVFDVQATSITVGRALNDFERQTNLESPHARLEQSTIVWADLCRLVTDYQETLRNKNALTAKLRNAGLANP